MVAGGQVAAQIIDPTVTFKTIHHKSYLRFYYDNDFFTKTDYYYTQGITVEYVHPSLRKNPVTKILPLASVVIELPASKSVPPELFAQSTFPKESYFTIKTLTCPVSVKVSLPKIRH